MGKGIATLCLLAGGFVAAIGLGFVPKDLLGITAPLELVAAGGILLALMGFSSLAQDHRISETLTSLLLLGLAGTAGWLLSLIHISEPTRLGMLSRMPSSA